MAGHLISRYFSNYDNFQIYEIKSNQVNNSWSLLKRQINNLKPDIIINSLRITVEESEKDPKTAILINSIIPKKLELLFLNTNVKIIHLSTDCVFSGEKGNYSEEEFPESKTIYGMTKFCGEIINRKDLTIRTSYIGPNLENKNEEIFDWFLKQKNDVNGYTNAIWNGVTTLELAKKIHESILKNISGLYHLCQNKKISKYNLLLLIQKQWSLEHINLIKSSDIIIDRSLKDSRSTLFVNNYNNMFEELYEFMQNMNEIYGHYKIN